VKSRFANSGFPAFFGSRHIDCSELIKQRTELTGFKEIVRARIAEGGATNAQNRQAKKPRRDWREKQFGCEGGVDGSIAFLNPLPSEGRGLGHRKKLI